VGRFVKGDIVVTPFPFSDLTGDKRRPAMVVAELRGRDVILCMITSQDARDDYAIPLSTDGFANGSLNKDSNIRPNRIFTADSSIILYTTGKLKKTKTDEVTSKILEIFTTVIRALR
jgi:mRNA interferase MazF